MTLLLWALYTPQQAAAQWVSHVGRASDVMQGVDLSSKVYLDTLTSAPHLYAVGPYEDLQGELTVFNSSTVHSEASEENAVTIAQEGWGRRAISTSGGWRARAPFLVYAYVPEWKTFELEVNLQHLGDIDRLIDSLMAAEGYDHDVATPFLVEGTFEEVEFHIIKRDTNETGHSHAQHKAAKKPFERSFKEAILVGFYSRHHEGIFTHKGSRLHVHWLSRDRRSTGHLDGIHHRGTITVSLPALY